MKPEYYIKKITAHLKLPDESWVTSECRLRETHAWPRQFLMYCLIKYEGYTLEVSGLVCNRDHSTANYAKKNVQNYLVNDQIFQDYYSALDEMIHEEKVKEKIKKQGRPYRDYHISKRKNNKILPKYVL